MGFSVASCPHLWHYYGNRNHNGAIMRPTEFSADMIVALLRKQTVASLSEVMAALGTGARRTAFRKLKGLATRTSYSHRGGYYTLDERVEFDQRGLWSFDGVRFSSVGTLIATAESFVNQAQAGHFSEELDNLLHVGAQDALRKLVGDGRLSRPSSRASSCIARPTARARRGNCARAACCWPRLDSGVPCPTPT